MMTPEQMVEVLAQVIVDQVKGDLADALILARALSGDLTNRVREKCCHD